VNAQINVKAYSEPIENGYAYIVDNNEVCPVSIKIKFKTKNLKAANNTEVYVIPANTKRFEVNRFKTIKKGKYSFSSQTLYNYGNVLKNNHNKDFNNTLPFEIGD
jgi:hypothetical protein